MNALQNKAQKKEWSTFLLACYEYSISLHPKV